MRNNSFQVGFILLGFTKWPHLEIILFWIVIILYAMIILSNSTIILLSCVDIHLYTPMYFFLSNLSFLDLCFTTTAVPQMLSNLWGPDKSITYTGCVIQLSVFLCLGATEGVMLVMMAFDRYVAICQPLHYTIIMNHQFCWKLVLIAWLSGLMESVTQSPITFQLPFCTHHHLDDFLCEVPAFIRLACGDTSAIEWQMTISADLFTIVPVVLILTSYGCIARALGKLHSEEGRKKAIATCSSHLIVVFMFYGTVAMVYADPKNHFASNYGKIFTFFYTLVTPLLNPLIYTLRNKEVKDALQRLLNKMMHK
ncbi:olfactory receptor 15-like [Meles meles]|uniref:olfactory receptor 15-like n=2 Tax=Meles meles TaxID=9662 RepID=UPI001E69D12E|nr:olfactory receptor 15-like [Meles meles]XP_045852766.1 olfactory receptor 15-like [Meles meles]XP_045852808.1 olfactory receptor 15-like [Meles meles]XP_045852820.1 olfactory receptor 15-like [Meles meles]XP_045852881.1 olfactory receptor 15-like [Meles meles]XP_045852885.1 olfactory receptor 15-like [Meles meles]XP_045852906.1 olfactory receptor 15-like [Meles meles]XP_045852947.1 olfactory receptor 15-like [Meles meles]XP_045855714.1 olfactory receptor 15-like [Meles meles]XP_04585706